VPVEVRGGAELHDVTPDGSLMGKFAGPRRARDRVRPSALYGIGASLYGARTGRRDWVDSGRRSVYALARS